MLTFAALTLIAVSLLLTARSTLTDTARAQGRVRGLQDRWLARSVERTLLDAAIDSRVEPTDDDPVKFDVTIGDRTISVEANVADEQAKVNANALYGRVGPKRARTVLDVISGPGVGTLRLRPVTTRARDEHDLPAFLTISQLAGDADTESLNTLASRITLWGDGTINVTRADPELIAAVLSGLVSRSEAEALSEAAADGQELQQALSVIVGESDALEQVKELVTDTSMCFSVRLTISDGARSSSCTAVGIAEGNPDEPDAEPLLVIRRILESGSR